MLTVLSALSESYTLILVMGECRSIKNKKKIIMQFPLHRGKKKKPTDYKRLCLDLG